MIKTGAVFFGTKNTMIISHFIFFISALYWSILYMKEIICSVSFVSFFIAFTIQVVTIVYIKIKGYNKCNIKYRSLYRFYYLLAGVVLFIYKMFLSIIKKT